MKTDCQKVPMLLGCRRTYTMIYTSLNPRLAVLRYLSRVQFEGDPRTAQHFQPCHSCCKQIMMYSCPRLNNCFFPPKIVLSCFPHLGMHIIRSSSNLKRIHVPYEYYLGVGATIVLPLYYGTNDPFSNGYQRPVYPSKQIIYNCYTRKMIFESPHIHLSYTRKAICNFVGRAHFSITPTIPEIVQIVSTVPISLYVGHYKLSTHRNLLFVFLSSQVHHRRRVGIRI